MIALIQDNQGTTEGSGARKLLLMIAKKIQLHGSPQDIPEIPVHSRQSTSTISAVWRTHWRTSSQQMDKEGWTNMRNGTCPTPKSHLQIEVPNLQKSPASPTRAPNNYVLTSSGCCLTPGDGANRCSLSWSGRSTVLIKDHGLLLKISIYLSL